MDLLSFFFRFFFVLPLSGIEMKFKRLAACVCVCVRVVDSR